MPRLKTAIGPRHDRRVLQNGTLGEVAALLAHYRSPATVTDRDGRTVKDVLLPRGDLNAVPLMLGVGITFCPNDLFNLSHLVGTLDDPDVLLGKIQALTDLGLPLTTRDPQGNTLLHRYARCFNDRVFDRLVSAGVDPTVANEHGETALHALVQSIDDTSTDFFEHLNPAPNHPVHHAFAMFQGLLDPGLGHALSNSLANGRRDHDRMVQWVDRFLAAGCRPQDTTDAGTSVFDLVRPAQHRWDAAVRAQRPDAPPGTAFMLVMAGKNRRRPEQYSPAHRALIERLEQAAGVTYLDRSPLTL